MAYDLEEQEQLDEFKVWWKKNGNKLINVVIGLLVVYIAYTAYQYFQGKKALEASTLYQNLVSLEPSKTAEIKAAAAKLMENYAGTPYAGRAALFAAKTNFAANDSKSAKAQLVWAQDKAQEPSLRAMAALQLATVLMGEKNYEEAIKTLNQVTDLGYAGLKDSTLGDVFLAQGKQAEAKKAFTSALENLEQGGRLHAIVQQKLESLGT